MPSKPPICDQCGVTPPKNYVLWETGWQKQDTVKYLCVECYEIERTLRVLHNMVVGPVEEGHYGL